MELVDTQDLKSCGHCVRIGSIPIPGTIKQKALSLIREGFLLYGTEENNGKLFTQRENYFAGVLLHIHISIISTHRIIAKKNTVKRGVFGKYENNYKRRAQHQREG